MGLDVLEMFGFWGDILGLLWVWVSGLVASFGFVWFVCSVIVLSAFVSDFMIWVWGLVLACGWVYLYVCWGWVCSGGDCLCLFVSAC